MSRVGWASRPPCCASRAAPGERPKPYECLSVFGCIPRDAEYGGRDAHPTQHLPISFSRVCIILRAETRFSIGPEFDTQPPPWRYDRGWVGNVVGIGNAYGFVEPLEATSLQVICLEASTLADSLLDCLCETNPSMIRLYNRYNNGQWDDIRNFLAIHYKFNRRIDTPFWRAVQADAKLHGAEEIVEWYQENGPSVLAGDALVHSSNSFRMDGFMAILVGQNVPY